MELQDLHERDQVAWLEEMAELVREQRYDALDYANLEIFLEEMAQRDRREVKSRLTVLLTHLLKSDYVTEKPARSWQATILNQRQELHELLQSATLENYFDTIVESAYANAVKRAALEMGLPESSFPARCLYSTEEILGEANK